MKRLTVVVALVVLLVAAASRAQAPKPYPELKQLEPFVGEWSIEGESRATPIGKAGRYTATLTVNWILSGFFLHWEGGLKSPDGEMKVIEVDSYDRLKGVFAAQIWDDGGSTTTGTYTPHGKVIEFSGKTVTPDTQYDLRAMYTVSADGMSCAYKDEISLDGKTWMPANESKWTKVKSSKK